MNTNKAMIYMVSIDGIAKTKALCESTVAAPGVKSGSKESFAFITVTGTMIMRSYIWRLSLHFSDQFQVALGLISLEVKVTLTLIKGMNKRLVLSHLTERESDTCMFWYW